MIWILVVVKLCQCVNAVTIVLRCYCCTVRCNLNFFYLDVFIDHDSIQIRFTLEALLKTQKQVKNLFCFRNERYDKT
jgi:hypothetical protein